MLRSKGICYNQLIIEFLTDNQGISAVLQCLNSLKDIDGVPAMLLLVVLNPDVRKNTATA